MVDEGRAKLSLRRASDGLAEATPTVETWVLRVVLGVAALLATVITIQAKDVRRDLATARERAYSMPEGLLVPRLGG